MSLARDGHFPSFTKEEITKCDRLLNELKERYSNGRNDGLLGAVHDRKITPAEYILLKSYIDWDLA